jgi:hypothetical protein
MILNFCSMMLRKKRRYIICVTIVKNQLLHSGSSTNLHQHCWTLLSDAVALKKSPWSLPVDWFSWTPTVYELELLIVCFLRFIRLCSSTEFGLIDLLKNKNYSSKFLRNWIGGLIIKEKLMLDSITSSSFYPNRLSICFSLSIQMLYLQLM